MTSLSLPCQDPQQWVGVETTLAKVQAALSSLENIPDVLDQAITTFSKLNPDVEDKTCTFFQKVPNSADAGKFDFQTFFGGGLPYLVDVALDMPTLFADFDSVPIHKTSSAWVEQVSSGLQKRQTCLTRRQCACLLAHSILGSLRRPSSVERNNFRFTAVDLFLGSAVSPNSAVTLLNYFNMMARYGDHPQIKEGSQSVLTYERRGYDPKSQCPWHWSPLNDMDGSPDKPLCPVSIADGSVENCDEADVQAEFANAFIGGGVMTGDFAMEEILFLVKPELMVAMALENRMADTEVIVIHNALQYSMIQGYGADFEFAGDYDIEKWPTTSENIPAVCAIDAIRGGGPAMTISGLLRDMNKARIAFDGFGTVATGHWGCGAFGNNHDLMFLKQWLAASQAGCAKMVYHEFRSKESKSSKHSHHIDPLIRKLLDNPSVATVGGLWNFLQQLSEDLKPCNMKKFSEIVALIATEKLKPEEYDAHRNSKQASETKNIQGASSSDTNTGGDGRKVIYQGVEMTCIKEAPNGQVRLQKPDGKTTWARRDSVEFVD